MEVGGYVATTAMAASIIAGRKAGEVARRGPEHREVHKHRSAERELGENDS